ncbi:helix-turn-helix domain-containing protein [Ruania suaedae]|uniref:helix-turn-helix domain-containing protein n=1 Tax=Ruania suaedae TaxID=2897774 RepID=UPI001E54976A|nr:helix-turn-helix domain-containing protein [Ruania suaedae]UFU01874.1 helix-turn-helix domain-containing protein [Ruania suaedae]
MGDTMEQTYLPSDTPSLAKIHSFLDAHAARGGTVKPRYLLVGADEGEQVELTEPIHRALVQIVDAMQRGRAVTVAPQSMTLTTQQAADLLGVSRPTVVRVIDSGELPADRVGNRRRLKLEDVLAYRNRRRAAQYAALDELAVQIDDEDDLESELARLRAVRSNLSPREGAAGTDLT